MASVDSVRSDPQQKRASTDRCRSAPQIRCSAVGSAPNRLCPRPRSGAKAAACPARVEGAVPVACVMQHRTGELGHHIDVPAVAGQRQVPRPGSARCRRGGRVEGRQGVIVEGALRDQIRAERDEVRGAPVGGDGAGVHVGVLDPRDDRADDAVAVHRHRDPEPTVIGRGDHRNTIGDKPR